MSGQETFIEEKKSLDVVNWELRRRQHDVNKAVTRGDRRIKGFLEVRGQLKVPGNDISLSSDQNNFAAPGVGTDRSSVLRITPSVDVTITGIKRRDSEFLWLVNKGPGVVILSTDDTNSKEENRIKAAGTLNRTIEIEPDGIAQLWYDTSILRWRVDRLGAGPNAYSVRITGGGPAYLVPEYVQMVFVDTDTGVATVTLRPGVFGRRVRVANTGSSGNNVTLNPDPAEQIQGLGVGVGITLIDSAVVNLHFDQTEGWW